MRTVSSGVMQGTQPPRDDPVYSLPKQCLHFFSRTSSLHPFLLPPSLSSFFAFSSFCFLLQILISTHYVPATVLVTVDTHQPLPVQSYREMGEEDKEQLTVQTNHYSGGGPWRASSGSGQQSGKLLSAWDGGRAGCRMIQQTKP